MNKNMNAFWDERYSAEEYIYGTAPNEFFKAVLDEFHPTGKILLPAEGEGRNAVYAAKKGLEVTAFDLSKEGKRKALKLADENGVDIKYEVGRFEEMKLPEAAYDVIAMIYAHFPPDRKAENYKSLMQYLKPGGLLIIEVFSKEHRKFQEENPHAGGPKNVDMLFSTAEIKSYFPTLDIMQLEEKEIELKEGSHHSGKGAVVRLVGRKS